MKLYKIFVRRKTGAGHGYMHAMAKSILQAKRLLKYNFGWIGSFGDWDEIEYVKEENADKEHLTMDKSIEMKLDKNKH